MKKGFTLIELSIVLIIIGLLTGGAFQLMKVMQVKARATEAKQTLQSTKEAIIAFTINNNRLPTQAEFTAMNLMGAGNIPIYYNSDAPLQINLCGQTTTLLNTTDANGVNTPNIGFVLAVAGENFNVQTGRQGDNITFYPWNTANKDDEPTVLNRPEPYDDLYVKVTLGELQSAVGCLPLKIINPQLPIGTVNTSYTAQISSEGGAGGYTYSYVPASVGGYTLPSNGTISHTWTAPVQPTAINITVTSGTATATRQYVLQIDNTNTGGAGGTGISAYDACIDGCGKPNDTGCINSCKKYLPK